MSELGKQLKVPVIVSVSVGQIVDEVAIHAEALRISDGLKQVVLPALDDGVGEQTRARQRAGNRQLGRVRLQHWRGLTLLERVDLFLPDVFRSHRPHDHE